MKVTTSSPVTFEFRHPMNPFFGLADYEMCNDNANVMLAELLDANVQKLGSSLNQTEFWQLARSLVFEVCRNFQGTTIADREVYHAIEKAFIDLFRQRGWECGTY
jgi:hypothetical protein